MRVVLDIAMRISVLLSVVMAGACLSSASSGQTVGRIGTGVPTQTPSSQSLISWSDFTYAGSCSVPVSSGSNGGDTRFTNSFSGRYVSGALQFLAVDDAGLYEFAPCSPSTNPDPTLIPSVTLLQDYGNVFSPKLTGQAPESGCTVAFGSAQVKGLRVVGSRLYYGYGSDYTPSGCDYDGGLGYLTLGTYPAAPTVVQNYTLRPTIGYKSGQRAFVEVPSSWSNGTYPNLTGMTLAQAGGGYESIITSGGTSMGPTIIPFTPPTGAEAERAALATFPLLYFSSGCSLRSRKPVVSPPFVNGVGDGCGNALFSWVDYIRGVEWLNTTNRKGLMHFATFNTGNSQYVGAIVSWQGIVNEVLITDPAVMIPIATGGALLGSIDWGTNTVVQWPFYDYTTPCASFAVCSDIPVSALTITGPTAVLTVADSSLVTTSDRIEVLGANQAEFNLAYRPAAIIDSTHVRVCSGSNGGTIDGGGNCTDADFANQTATGTIFYHKLQNSGSPNPVGVQASWFDTTTNTLWLISTVNFAKMVLHKYTCAAC